MKSNFVRTVLLLSCLTISRADVHSQSGVAINLDGLSPDNSAVLDISSTAKGALYDSGSGWPDQTEARIVDISSFFILKNFYYEFKIRGHSSQFPGPHNGW